MLFRDGNSNGLSLPPGSKGYPLIGKFFDMPVRKPWVAYDEWRKTYGKFILFNLIHISAFPSERIIGAAI